MKLVPCQKLQAHSIILYVQKTNLKARRKGNEIDTCTFFGGGCVAHLIRLNSSLKKAY